MRKIDEFFDSTPKKTLFHYTGIGALLGIEQSESLWASSVYFLNDGEEIVYAQKLLTNLLKDKLKEVNGVEETFLNQFIDWLKPFSSIPYNMFIFSLSEEQNLLSQWRSYTPHGKGVSVGFSPMVVENIIKENELKIAKCRYDKDEHNEILYILLGRMLHTFGNRYSEIDISKGPPNQEYHKFLEEFRGDILQVFSTIKHPAFKEEKEWRLISKYYESYVVPDIKYREGASMLVPFIELKIQRWHDNPQHTHSVYFESVCLGPSQHSNLSFNALQNFLSNKRISHMTIGSGVPYREWQ